ncbi:MAG: UMP kinase [Candidatus Dasytiphilus stammeri]
MNKLGKTNYYQRILLKISGESLQGIKKFGIDSKILQHLVQEIKDIVNLSVQVGIVIGGGNIFRGSDLIKIGINKVIADEIGMLATIMNSLAIQDALHRSSVKVNLMSAIPINGICEIYSWEKAISLLNDQYVVIFAAGLGNPFFTTDSAACLRGIEINADIILKATQVDGIFSNDPLLDQCATLYKKLTYQEVLDNKLKVMDFTAFILARDHQIPIQVFNVTKPGALRRIIFGEIEGTLITC